MRVILEGKGRKGRFGVSVGWLVGPEDDRGVWHASADVMGDEFWNRDLLNKLRSSFLLRSPAMTYVRARVGGEY